MNIKQKILSRKTKQMLKDYPKWTYRKIRRILKESWLKDNFQ